MINEAEAFTPRTTTIYQARTIAVGQVSEISLKLSENQINYAAVLKNWRAKYIFSPTRSLEKTIWMKKNNFKKNVKKILKKCKSFYKKTLPL